MFIVLKNEIKDHRFKNFKTVTKKLNPASKNVIHLSFYFVPSEPCDCPSVNTGGGPLRFSCSGATISGEVRRKLFISSIHSCLLVCPAPLKRQPFSFSCLSDAASGLSDGNEGGSTSGGLHEGRSLKRHQRRSVRSRSRHEKTARAKLNVLSVRRRCLNQNQKCLVLVRHSHSHIK